ncbi:DUF3574 domain-containing protein [Gloeobacter morelensis MG652769]|uniref:DUF3574 domain-containing protein n=2 Tax=Gloeobacter TaxID=33071 RepID=A0ABY3PMD5_9CYAN|nr:DUF3574 domain-containing protein [Gloeobacter morelensis MG652769]
MAKVINRSIFMKCNVRLFAASITLAAGLLWHSVSAPHAFAQQNEASSVSGFCQEELGGELFFRTELFFGLSKSDGSQVSEAEFQGFVDTVVTPLFPDGLTLLTGQGQFKDSTGTIIEEGSKLLILLYPFSRESSAKVNQVREAYKDSFQQQSVLRTDEQSCLSF